MIPLALNLNKALLLAVLATAGLGSAMSLLHYRADNSPRRDLRINIADALTPLAAIAACCTLAFALCAIAEATGFVEWLTTP